MTKRIIEKHLKPGRQGSIVCLSEADSTNRIAGYMVREGVADGTVVIANSQTAGAGRLGRSFYSPADAGIYFSYIKETGGGTLPKNFGLLTSLAGLAVCSAITAVCGLPAQIKWPNDILIGGKKVCGILTMLITDSAANRITHAVIGIGVNVNESEGDFPEELSAKAGSLRMAAGRPVDRAELCAAIISRLDEILFTENALYAEAAPYIGNLRELSCTIGKTVTVSSSEGVETGLALDFAPDGGLMLETPNGVKTVRSGEIL